MSGGKDAGCYLPQYPLVNWNKPSKLRIVFDYAAQYTLHSLNIDIKRKADLTNDLMDVLLRFRKYSRAICADSE